MRIFDLDYSEWNCFRQVTRMAEANVGPPESAPDESGSGEEQKEEKQEEEEGDRAFEVKILPQLQITGSHVMICHYHNFHWNLPIQCNICLDTARDAVVSMCGHLFCWPCLHQVAKPIINVHACP